MDIDLIEPPAPEEGQEPGKYVLKYTDDQVNLSNEYRHRPSVTDIMQFKETVQFALRRANREDEARYQADPTD